MKTNRLTKVIYSLAFLTMINVASAATIASTYLIGTVDPGNPASPSIELARLQFLVTSYNGGSASGVVANPSDTTHTYTLTLGTDVPSAPLLSPVVTASAQLAGGFTSSSVDFGVGYEYLMVKWADTDAYYYIGGLTGQNTILNDVVFNKNGKAQDASHYVFFNQSAGPRDIDPPPSVPDGGTTLLSLGISLLGLGGFRRFFVTKA